MNNLCSLNLRVWSSVGVFLSVGIGQRLSCTIILTREDGGGGVASVGLYGN